MDLLSIFYYNQITGELVRKRNNKKCGTIRTKSHSGKKYLVTGLNGKQEYIHRIVWAINTGRFPELGIDHINGNPFDNRFENLRTVSPLINSRNMKKYKNNSSGVCGVAWNSKRKKWHSYISNSGKRINLIYSCDLFEAVCARKSAELDIGGFSERHGK